MPRLPYLFIPAIIAIGLFFGIDVMDPAQTRNPVNSGSLNLNYDAWSEGINTVLHDESGAISYTLQAARQVHLTDDTTQLEEPYIRLYKTNGQRWNIVADSGRISARNPAVTTPAQEIILLGDVQIFSLDDFGNRTLLRTEQLSIDPETEVAATEQPVTLETVNIQHAATGMVANLADDRIVFLRNNEGSYAAPQ